MSYLRTNTWPWGTRRILPHASAGLAGPNFIAEEAYEGRDLEAFIDEGKIKQLFKEALVEVIEERKEVFYELLTEVLEDIAIVPTVKKGEDTEPVSKDEVLKTVGRCGVRVEFRTSFTRDLRPMRDRALLQRIQETIEEVEAAESLQDIVHLTKLRAEAHYYRIRLGNYRIGLIVRSCNISSD